MGKVFNSTDLSLIARKIRREVLQAIYTAGSGHPGGSLSATDLLVALYFGGVMSAGDRFILSAGHLCPAWYATLNYKSQIPNYKLRKLGSPLQGHPYKIMAPFVETSTGSLGQGISVGVGLALGLKMKKKKGLVFVLSSNGEQEEGQVWEAAMFARQHNLNNLCLIIDDNGMQIGGETEKITALELLNEKYEAFGWRALEINGHNFDQILTALRMAGKDSVPLVIVAKTIRGKGVSFMENQLKYHSTSLTKEELERALRELK